MKVSEESKTLSKEFEKSENDLKALQSVGQVRIALNWGFFFLLNEIFNEMLHSSLDCRRSAQAVNWGKM